MISSGRRVKHEQFRRIQANQGFVMFSDVAFPKQWRERI